MFQFPAGIIFVRTNAVSAGTGALVIGVSIPCGNYFCSDKYRNCKDGIIFAIEFQFPAGIIFVRTEKEEDSTPGSCLVSIPCGNYFCSDLPEWAPVLFKALEFQFPQGIETLARPCRAQPRQAASSEQK